MTAWPKLLLAGLLLLAAANQAAAQERAAAESVGASGLPLPRFVSIRADRANMRTGPGEQYPILWVYVRPGLPLEIIGEYGPWRRVRDWDGTAGWMHRALLSGDRTALISGGTRTLRRDAATTAAPVLRAEPGVIGEIRECNDGWCRLEIGNRAGWLPRSEIWGTYENEDFD